MKKKEILKTIITIIVSVVLSSGISVYATSTYLYDSCDVSYDNTSSGLNASNVQSSLDELYMHATDYTSIDSRVSSLESHFLNNSTSVFDGNWLRLNGISNSENGLIIRDNSGTNRGVISYSPSSNILNIDSRNSSGSYGQGSLYLAGNPVKINGTSIGDLIKAKTVVVPCTSLSQGYNLSSLISLDSGYKFLAWESVGSSNGWVSGFPIYIANPLSTSGGVYWNGTLGTGSTHRVVFTYFEIKT